MVAIESPLFQSAMELFGHSISHYNGKNELDRKLVILHLANAVELILKDLVLDAGKSIYKNPKETITIQGCLGALSDAGVSLPLLNKIELLVDERNALQHRFGSPNELTVIFYMNIAKEFFQKVLRNNYGQDLEELLTQFADESELAAYRLGEPDNDQELEKLQELAKIHPLGALLAAWTYFEKTLDKFVAQLDVKVRTRRPFAMDLAIGNVKRWGLEFPESLRDKIDAMRRARNMAAHGKAEPSREQVREVITAIEEVEVYLNSLDIAEVRARALEEQKEHERRINEQAEREREAGDIGELLWLKGVAEAEAEQEEND